MPNCHRGLQMDTLSQGYGVLCPYPVHPCMDGRSNLVIRRYCQVGMGSMDDPTVTWSVRWVCATWIPLCDRLV